MQRLLCIIIINLGRFSMSELSIFKNMSDTEINEVLKSLGARRISFKKEHIIYEIDNKDENLSKLISIYDDIVDNYYDEIDEEGMVNSAIEGMLGFLEDKYSIYLSGRDSELYGDSYSGIGILANYNVIEYVYDDTPAMKAGLKPGDEIIKVNGTEINKDNYADISNLLKANGEKENEIIVKRNNEEVTFKVKVDSVNVPVTAEDVITKDGHKIGYIRLSSFTKSSYKQFKKSLDNVNAHVTGNVLNSINMSKYAYGKYYYYSEDGQKKRRR